MKKFFYASIFCLLLFSCSSDNNDCACYEAALKANELSDECKALVDGLNEDQLKEKSNECFVGAIEELSGIN